MVEIALTGLISFGILLLSEVLWRKRIMRGEYSRKFVHIGAGLFTASWAWFLSWRQIVVLAAAGGLVLLTSRLLRIFHGINDVKRKSYGDVFSSCGIMIAAAIAKDNKWLFACSVLMMVLADGLAAVIGTKYGMKTKYKVFGFTKTLVGTATFVAVASLVCVSYVLAVKAPGSSVVTSLMVVGIAAGLAASENALPYGLDNVALPAACALLLGTLFR